MGIVKVIFLILAIIVILAFVGVEPLATHKDRLIAISAYKVDEWKEEIRIQQIEYEIEKVEEAKLKYARQTEEYCLLFNEYREKRRIKTLIFDSKLNELAKQRCIEIAIPGNFNHEGIKPYNLGENIAMMSHSFDTNSQLIELWADSPEHNRNMLNTMYRMSGFARVGKYAVQLFR